MPRFLLSMDLYGPENSKLKGFRFFCIREVIHLFGEFPLYSTLETFRNATAEDFRNTGVKSIDFELALHVMNDFQDTVPLT